MQTILNLHYYFLQKLIIASKIQTISTQSLISKRLESISTLFVSNIALTVNTNLMSILTACSTGGWDSEEDNIDVPPPPLSAARPRGVIGRCSGERRQVISLRQ